MESTLKVTLRELFRYRGFWGQWTWAAHRLSGLGVLFFLMIHVWDTANAAFWPEAYTYTVEIFKWFPFSVLEILLMAAVLYHAFNGIRVTILDFKPEWWQYQQKSAFVVWILFAIVFIPIGVLMFSNTLQHCSLLAAEGSSCFAFPTP